MKKILLVLLLFAITSGMVFAEVIIFEGWSVWGNGLRAAPRGNTVTFSGNVTSVAGYVNEWLNVTDLRGKTVILEIQNAGASNFSNSRMLKITINRNDQLVRPTNVPYLIEDEYVPASVTRIEFTLPNTFDGKLGLVFYGAELNNLQITATYR